MPGPRRSGREGSVLVTWHDALERGRARESLAPPGHDQPP